MPSDAASGAAPWSAALRIFENGGCGRIQETVSIRDLSPRATKNSAARLRGLVYGCGVHAALFSLLWMTSSRVPPPAVAAAPPLVVTIEAPRRAADSPRPSASALPVNSTAPAPDERPAPPVVSADVPVLDIQALPLDAATRPSIPAPPPTPAERTSAPVPLAASSLPAQASPAVGTLSASSNWSGLVLGRLEQHKRYPSAARARLEEGIVYIRFVIDREGRVDNAVLERSSGHPLLDREALALLRRAQPLPPPPADVPGERITLTVPVEFFLSAPR